MSRVPVGKVLLRNVIRHTGAHNKVRPGPAGGPGRCGVAGAVAVLSCRPREEPRGAAAGRLPRGVGCAGRRAAWLRFLLAPLTVPFVSFQTACRRR